jgi:hypothetical protein
VRRAGRGGHHYMVNLPGHQRHGDRRRDISHGQRAPHVQ